jgi:hypothetical protein
LGPRVGLDDMDKCKLLTLPGLELRLLGRAARRQSSKKELRLIVLQVLIKHSTAVRQHMLFVRIIPKLFNAFELGVHKFVNHTRIKYSIFKLVTFLLSFFPGFMFTSDAIEVEVEIAIAKLKKV